MDYRPLHPQPGMARLNGSNRVAWNAMDLEIGAQVPSPNARGGVEDCGALSARNVLLRQKLRERKRYDSADDAMKKAAARAARRYQSPTSIPSSQTQQQQQEMMPAQQQNQIQPGEQTLSPAQMGQSAFLNAMDSGTSKRNAHQNTSTPMHEPRGGAERGRNVLIQRKLQSKISFDSADYQMAKVRRGQEAYMEDTHMEDVRETERANEEAVSSPCASFATAASRRQQFASMSPSRTGKYGALENKKKSSRRGLLEQQQLENPTAAIEIGADEKVQHARGSDYGKLSAAHVLIRRKLKERKRFDSADYAMEKQGQPTDVPADVATSPAAPGTASSRYGTLGVSQAAINHQVKHIKLSEAPSGRVVSPVVANAAQAALAARAARYAGLKGAKNENDMVDDNTSQAAFDRYGLDKSASPLSAAAARNIVLQRKLAERKVFDSADHFKEAA